jgi:hypothetical protein
MLSFLVLIIHRADYEFLSHLCGGEFHYANGFDPATFLSHLCGGE